MAFRMNTFRELLAESRTTRPCRNASVTARGYLPQGVPVKSPRRETGLNRGGTAETQPALWPILAGAGFCTLLPRNRRIIPW